MNDERWFKVLVVSVVVVVGCAISLAALTIVGGLFKFIVMAAA